MKPFKVNRDSWHYKLNKHFLNDRGDNEYYMQDYWERKHNNFCAYWRVTMFRLVVAMFGSAIILMLLFGLGVRSRDNPELINEVNLRPLSGTNGTRAYGS